MDWLDLLAVSYPPHREPVPALESLSFPWRVCLSPGEPVPALESLALDPSLMGQGRHGLALQLTSGWSAPGQRLPASVSWGAVSVGPECKVTLLSR